MKTKFVKISNLLDKIEFRHIRFVMWFLVGLIALYLCFYTSSIFDLIITIIIGCLCLLMALRK